jgi:LacI family transcriptional regulator
MKRITIRDLAKLLSLSPSTVSRALSDHPDISESTKQRVKEVAETINYSVNLHASIFRNKKSNLIALIIPEINMFYVPALIEGINNSLNSSDYSLFVFISKDKVKREEEIIKQCIKWAVEGVLISLSSQTENLNHLEALSLAGIKTVILDRIIKNDKFPSITLSNKSTTQQAIEYLISKGHKNILGIFGKPKLSTTLGRIEGFKNALRNNDIQIEEENILSINRPIELESILPIILNYKKEITAIFTMSDEMLAKVNYELTKLGKKIKEDISIISISDGLFPYLVFPNVTFIKDSGNRMGKKASELLISQISKGENAETVHLQLPAKLVELDSVEDIC